MINYWQKKNSSWSLLSSLTNCSIPCLYNFCFFLYPTEKKKLVENLQLSKLIQRFCRQLVFNIWRHCWMIEELWRHFQVDVRLTRSSGWRRWPYPVFRRPTWRSQKIRHGQQQSRSQIRGARGTARGRRWRRPGMTSLIWFDDLIRLFCDVIKLIWWPRSKATFITSYCFCYMFTDTLSDEFDFVRNISQLL